MQLKPVTDRRRLFCYYGRMHNTASQPLSSLSPNQIVAMHTKLEAAYKSADKRKPTAAMQALGSPQAWLAYGVHSASGQRRSPRLEAILRRFAFQHAAEAWATADTTGGLQLAIGFNSALREFGPDVATWAMTGIAYASAVMPKQLHERLHGLPPQARERAVVEQIVERLTSLKAERVLPSPLIAEKVEAALTGKTPPSVSPARPPVIAKGQNYSLPL